MIEKDGVAWIHQDGQREEMKNVTADTVVDGHELYNQAVGRVNAHQRDRVAATKRILADDGADPENSAEQWLGRCWQQSRPNRTPGV